MLSQGYFLNRYEIRSIIGRGGFGVVYKGVHRELGIEVAIKEFFPSELCVRHDQTVKPRKPEFQDSFEESLNRFIREAKQLEELRDCPNIVNCRDLFRANGTAYIVMDYVAGIPLSVLLERREARGKPFTEKILLQVIMPLLRGLQTVHESGVCHRDIKPSNILIRRIGRVPILIDFGAAKHEFSRHTKSFAPYSDGYAAMEQVGEGEIGSWTDMYGVGAVMWRMVAGGDPPFSPPNPVAVQRRAFELTQGRVDPLPSARKLGKQRFSERTLKTIDGCLVLNVKDRVQTAAELIRKLAPPDGAATPPATKKPAKETRIIPRPPTKPSSHGPAPGHRFHEIPRTIPRPPIRLSSPLSVTQKPVKNPPKPDPGFVLGTWFGKFWALIVSLGIFIGALVRVLWIVFLVLATVYYGGAGGSWMGGLIWGEEGALAGALMGIGLVGGGWMGGWRWKRRRKWIGVLIGALVGTAIGALIGSSLYELGLFR